MNEEERELHRKDIADRYVLIAWTWKDVVQVITDLRIWPLIIMYFGVVGTGFGLAVYGSTIIATNNPNLTSIQVSLLYAPIWLFDLAGILIVTPFATNIRSTEQPCFRLLVLSLSHECLLLHLQKGLGTNTEAC